MAGKIRTYRDLDIWKTSIQLVKDVYKLTEKFPRHEFYGLVSQMRRAGVSIPSNVAIRPYLPNGLKLAKETLT